MTQEEIIKGNEQLAIMLGFEKSTTSNNNIYWRNPKSKYWRRTKDLDFHWDWNKLMEVLKFILTELESVTEDMEIWYSLVDQIPDIEATWKVAVNIATEENKRKKSNT